MSFLVQKVLIHSRRSREDRAKDILYMHDTLEVFGRRLVELRGLWLNRVAQRLHPNSMSSMLGAQERLFGEISDDIRRGAGSPPSVNSHPKP